MKRLGTSILSSIALAFAFGCANLTTMHTARSVGRGHTRVAASGVAAGTTVEAKKQRANNAGFLTMDVRHGFTDAVDLGIKLFPLGGQADLNITVVDGEMFALSIDPSAGIHVSDDFGGADTSLAVLLDVGRRDGIVFTVGPRAGALWSVSRRTSEGIVMIAGGSLGVRLPLGAGIQLFPEGALFYATDFDRGGLLWTAGLGLAFLP